MYRVRNYLAHYSAKSRRVLWHMYKTKYQFKRWVEPGKFLVTKDGRRLWECFDAFEGASKDMQGWY